MKYLKVEKLNSTRRFLQRPYYWWATIGSDCDGGCSFTKEGGIRKARKAIKRMQQREERLSQPQVVFEEGSRYGEVS